MSTEPPTPANRRDWLGIVFSSLCVVHCLAPLVLALTGGSIAGLALFEDEWVHKALLVLVPAIALWSLLPSFSHHRQPLPLILAAIGIPLLFLAVAMGEAAETPLTVAGGLTVVVAHALNWRWLSQQVPNTGEARDDVQPAEI